MIFRLLSLLSHPLLAEDTPERRGKLIEYFLASVVILIIGFTMVIRNRKKKKWVLQPRCQPCRSSGTTHGTPSSCDPPPQPVA
jgi:hypothetical protein